jgi:hypothetical protein
MINYTKIGKRYNKNDIDVAINQIKWEDFKTEDLPFMQVEAIKQVISTCNIPLKGIKKMALHNCINYNGETHSLYGLDVKYKNGNAKIYIADSGCDIVVVASVFIMN